MIEAETKKQIDELVELNRQLLAQNEEVKQENADLRKVSEELTQQLAAEGRVAALRAENAELRKRLAAAGAGRAQPATTSAYNQLASLAKERAAQTHVTVEKAFTQIIAEQPDLYRRHREELRSSR